MGQEQAKAVEPSPKDVTTIKPLPGDVESLRTSLEGKLFLPMDPEYTTNRVAWNKVRII